MQRLHNVRMESLVRNKIGHIPYKNAVNFFYLLVDSLPDFESDSFDELVSKQGSELFYRAQMRTLFLNPERGGS